jgi:hypothetical protein
MIKQILNQKLRNHMKLEAVQASHLIQDLIQYQHKIDLLHKLLVIII